MTRNLLKWPSEVKTKQGLVACPKEIVTVVVTCHNQGHFLRESIGSILSQTRLPDEILIVDDGSSDNTRDEARRFPEVIYIRRTTRVWRLRVIPASPGAADYFVFLDADDRLLPHALEAGLDDFAAHPECAFVFGAFRKIDATGKPLGERAHAAVGRGRLSGSSQEQPDMHARHRDVSAARARGRRRLRHLASGLRGSRSVSQDCSALSRAPARKTRGGI